MKAPRLGRWHWPIAAGIYALLAVAITWPVVARFSTQVAGFADRDSLQYTWSLWWAKQAWANGLSPADTVLLYWPQQARNALLAVAPLLDWLAFPLQGWLSATQVYNALFLASLIFSALAMYALAHERTGSFWGALLAGALYAYNAPRLGHALLGHLTHLAAWWLPLALLFGLRALDRARLRDAALCGLCGGLGMLVAPVQAAYLMAPGLVLVLGFEALRRRRTLERRHLWAGLLAVGVIAAVVLPVYGPFLREALGDGLDLGAQGVADYSVDPALMVLPSPYHPLWGQLTRGLGLVQDAMPEANDVEKLAYLGLLPLALALWGWARARRDRWPWLALLLAALVLAMGPYLKIAGHTTAIPLPYALLLKLPLFSWGRTPERFLQLASLAIALLAALAVAGWRPRWPVGAGLLVACVLGALPLWPFPQGTSVPPAELATWHDQGGVVLDLPISKRQVGNLAMYYQTEHGLPIVGGYIHRDPPGQRDYVKALDAAILAQGDDAARPLTSAELEAMLQGLDIRHVLLHRDYLKADDLAALQERLSAALGATPDDWGPVLAYEVPARPPLPAPEAVYADQLALAVGDAVYTEGRLTVSLNWQAQVICERNWTVFVHVQDAKGQRLGQHDGPPAGGNLPTSLWAAGQTVLDQHEIEGLPEPDESWTLVIGLYDPETGERASVSSTIYPVSNEAITVPLTGRLIVR